MFDFKALFDKAVEEKAIDINEYIFMPERFDTIIDGGNLCCVLNTNGKVDFIYTKGGITEVQSSVRKNPFTAFQTELHYGVYDDLIDELLEKVNKIIEGKSKYFEFSPVAVTTHVLSN